MRVFGTFASARHECAATAAGADQPDVDALVGPDWLRRTRGLASAVDAVAARKWRRERLERAMIVLR